MSTAEATPVAELPITIRGPIRMTYEEWLAHEHEGGLTEDERGLFQPVPLALDNIYRASVVPGFWLKTDWLWEEGGDACSALRQVAGKQHMLTLLEAEEGT